jgi:hypothetical protein
MLDDATALDQLSAIRAMINDTRRSAAHHWMYLLIWGGLGVVAALASHVLLHTPHDAAIWLVWLAYSLVGSVVSSAFGLRAERRARTRTFIDRIMSAVWNAIGITIILLWLAALIGALPVQFLPAMIVLVAASGLCVMGAVLEFWMLYAAAGLWWAGGVYTLFHPMESFLVVAVLIVLGYLVPAAMLRRQVATDDASD